MSEGRKYKIVEPTRHAIIQNTAMTMKVAVSVSMVLGSDFGSILSICFLLRSDL